MDNARKFLLDVLQVHRFRKSVMNITRKRLRITPGKSIRDTEDSSCVSDMTDASGCESESEMEVDELTSASPSNLSNNAAAYTGSNYSPKTMDGCWFIANFFIGRIYENFVVLEVDAPSSDDLLNVICLRKKQGLILLFSQGKRVSIHPSRSGSGRLNSLMAQNFYLIMTGYLILHMFDFFFSFLF